MSVDRALVLTALVLFECSRPPDSQAPPQSQAPYQIPPDNANPISDFRAEPRYGLAPLTVQFTDQTWPALSTIDSWEWKFGDGATSSEQNPTHTYDSPGNYAVSMRITTDTDYERGSWKPGLITVHSTPDTLPNDDAGDLLLIEPTKRARPKVTIAHPARPESSVTLWAPENTSFPNFEELSRNPLSEGPIDWHDLEGGAIGFTLDHPDAAVDTSFAPGPNYVRFEAKLRSKSGKAPDVTSFRVNPCLSLMDSVFTGNDAEMRERTWYLSDEGWERVADSDEANFVNTIADPRKPKVPNERISIMSTIYQPRAVSSLLACTSRDGHWVIGIGGLHDTYDLFANSMPSMRCIHSEATVPLDAEGNSSVVIMIYLLPGTLDELRALHEGTQAAWRTTTKPAD